MSDQPNPIFPVGGAKTEPGTGPEAAYEGTGTFVPQPIGQPAHHGAQPDQSTINQEIFDSQQGKAVQLNLPWLLSQPDSPSKRGLIEIVAALNKLVGS